jgi:hypothetical protein
VYVSSSLSIEKGGVDIGHRHDVYLINLEVTASKIQDARLSWPPLLRIPCSELKKKLSTHIHWSRGSCRARALFLVYYIE